MSSLLGSGAAEGVERSMTVALDQQVRACSVQYTHKYYCSLEHVASIKYPTICLERPCKQGLLHLLTSCQVATISHVAFSLCPELLPASTVAAPCSCSRGTPSCTLFKSERVSLLYSEQRVFHSLSLLLFASYVYLVREDSVLRSVTMATKVSDVISLLGEIP